MQVINFYSPENSKMQQTEILTPSFLIDASDLLGLPLDILKTLVVIFSSIALAPFFHMINRPIFRILFSFIPSFFLLPFLLHEWFLYLVAISFISYIIIRIVPSKKYLITLVSSFCFLLFIHSHRFIFDYQSWKIDCSVLVMIMITKVTYFARYSQNEKSQPSFLCYFGYCFYFPGVSIGPTFQYEKYLDFVQKKKNFENIPIVHSTFLKTITEALILLIVVSFIMPIFTSYWVLENQYYLSLPTVVKFLSLNIIGVLYRLKFYAAWGLAQTGVNLSGLSWDSSSKSFDGVQTGSSYFQFEPNPKKKTQYWNTSVQLWLKNCFYDPILSITKSQTIATYITFITSAFWHGIYWTYYLGFVQWAILMVITKWVYKMSLTMNEKILNSKVVKLMAFLGGALFMNYIGMFIVVLTWDEAVKFYSDINYIGTYLLIILLVASLVVKPKKRK